MKNPDGPGWLMFMVARVPGIAEPNAGGSIGLAASDDLYTWTLLPPVYRGGLFGQMEVPQVFQYGAKWYCVFCTAAEHWSKAYRASNTQPPVSGTHYLVADHPLGPWTVAPGPFLDGHDPCRRYSGKVLQTDGGLVTIGFIHTTPVQSFVGVVSDPIPVSVDAGWLVAHPDLLPPGSTI